MSEAATAAPKKGRKVLLLLVCVVFTVAGAALPMLVNIPALFAKNKGGEKDKADAKAAPKTATIPFGEVVVNLAEDRMTRYLRLKIAVVVDAEKEKELAEAVTKHKASLKSKCIGHLAGKTLKDVSGSVGVSRVQRELLDRFEEVLYPDGNSHLRAVLFEEYVVQ
ncbi:flagellar basal body-associated protein : Marine sediment metagenome DNA, contig: S03H2_S09489 (Fragment) OS=marine sediment metagenome GN=S03H2_41710 PE=4 SV=1: FliL [Gemmataceae bacterium]